MNFGAFEAQMLLESVVNAKNAVTRRGRGGAPRLCARSHPVIWRNCSPRPRGAGSSAKASYSAR